MMPPEQDGNFRDPVGGNVVCRLYLMSMLQKTKQNKYLTTCHTYYVTGPGLVSFVVQVSVLLLEVKLDPVVKTNDFSPRFSLSNKDMLEAARVQSGECFSSETSQKMTSKQSST